MEIGRYEQTGYTYTKIDGTYNGSIEITNWDTDNTTLTIRGKEIDHSIVVDTKKLIHALTNSHKNKK